MNKIYIGFSRPTSFKIGAEFIKLWQNASFSHTYIKFNEEIIIHAAHGRVHCLTEEMFLKQNVVIKEYALEIESTTNAMLYCLTKVNEPYGYLELVKIFLYDIFHNLGIKLPFKDSNGYICSEFVGWVLTTQFDLEFDKPHFLLTPKDIYLKLQDIYG